MRPSIPLFGEVVNPSATSLRDVLGREIKTAELLRALIVVGPMVAAYFIARETALLNLGLVAVSLLIPALRLHCPPKVIAWHYLAILVTFATLFLAAPIKPLFVVLTALAGFLAVAGTHYGEHFRTLGNWVFIPAVYLACEVREGVSASESLRHAGVIILASPIALALVCGIQVYDQRRVAIPRPRSGRLQPSGFFPRSRRPWRCSRRPRWSRS